MRNSWRRALAKSVPRLEFLCLFAGEHGLLTRDRLHVGIDLLAVTRVDLAGDAAHVFGNIALMVASTQRDRPANGLHGRSRKGGDEFVAIEITCLFHSCRPGLDRGVAEDRPSRGPFMITRVIRLGETLHPLTLHRPVWGTIE